jgi:DNA-directed RNA polymerase subunit omega
MSEEVISINQQLGEFEGKPPDMPFFIPTDSEQSVYRFIIAAAKRARQLQAGARPLISTTSRKPTKIAMEEVRRGEIPVEIPAADDEDESTEK